jgi:cytoskeleton-associated protein 5
MEILNHLNAKQPKLVAAAVASLKEIVRLFGAKTVDVKPVMKALVPIFSHSDPQVRTEANQLVLELSKWLGKNAFEGIFKELKPVQVKELSDSMESLEEKGVQRRFLRSQSSLEAVEVVDVPGENPSSGIEQEAVAEPVAVDAYDVADPVNVLGRIFPSFWDDCNSVKWKERKEALDSLVKILDTPRYAEDSYHELMGTLTKRLSDVNILVVTSAINCIEKVACGLRASFSPFKSQVVSPMLDKFKERKQTVVQSLRDALDAVFQTVALPDVLGEIIEASKSKNPQVRQETMLWLVRCLKASKKAPPKPEQKPLVEMLTKMIEDSAPEVREASMEALGTVMRVCGERAIAHFLEKVDPIKMTKIKEYQAKAEVRAVPSSSGDVSARPATAPVHSSAASSVAVTKRPSVSAAPSPKVVRRPSKPAVSRAPSAAASRLTSSKPASASSTLKKPAPTKPVEIAVKFLYSDEDALARVSEYLEESEVAMLNDSAWKVRLEVMDKLNESMKERDDADGELLFRILRKQAIWKDNNFQVMSRLIQIASTLAGKQKLTKAASSLIIPTLVEKTGDMKLKPVAYEALVAIAERCTLGFVLGRSYDTLNVQKGPKVIAEIVKAFRELLNEFGVAGVHVQDLINVTKTHLGNSNPAVRTACVQLLGTLRVFMGPDVRTLIADLPPAQLATIDAEFEKVAKDEKPEVKRQQNVRSSH